MHRDSSIGTVYEIPSGVRESCFMCSEEHDGKQTLCYFCFLEQRKVALHCASSKRNHLPGDLTLEQWMQTVKEFDWKCAYCLKHPYGVLEHFIPRNLGGGTTKSNCVPACYRCNALKKRQHPDLVVGISKRAIERVCEYLAIFEKDPNS